MTLALLSLWACGPQENPSPAEAPTVSDAPPPARWTEGHRPRTTTGRTPVPSPHVSTFRGELTLDGRTTRLLEIPAGTTIVTLSMAANAPWSEAQGILQQAREAGVEQVHFVAEGAIRPIEQGDGRIGRIPLHVHPILLTAQPPALSLSLDRGVTWSGASEGGHPCAEPCSTLEDWPVEASREDLSGITGAMTIQASESTPVQVVTSYVAMLEQLSGSIPAVD